MGGVSQKWTTDLKDLGLNKSCLAYTPRAVGDISRYEYYYYELCDRYFRTPINKQVHTVVCWQRMSHYPKTFELAKKLYAKSAYMQFSDATPHWNLTYWDLLQLCEKTTMDLSNLHIITYMIYLQPNTYHDIEDTFHEEFQHEQKKLMDKYFEQCNIEAHRYHN
jgi:hypothetical protein